MPRCAGPAGACSARPGSRKSADPSSGLLRRSPHGSGRSAPSRAAALSQSMPIPWRLFPLTARLAGRCPWRASRSKPARGRTYQPLLTNRMPACSLCHHLGGDHDWTSPPCSVPDCHCLRQHPRRLRGRCLVPGCDCRKYVPRTERPKPVNHYIGRGRR